MQISPDVMRATTHGLAFEYYLRLRVQRVVVRSGGPCGAGGKACGEGCQRRAELGWASHGEVESESCHDTRHAVEVVRTDA